MEIRRIMTGQRCRRTSIRGDEDEIDLRCMRTEQTQVQGYMKDFLRDSSLSRGRLGMIRIGF